MSENSYKHDRYFSQCMYKKAYDTTTDDSHPTHITLLFFDIPLVCSASELASLCKEEPIPFLVLQFLPCKNPRFTQANERPKGANQNYKRKNALKAPIKTTSERYKRTNALKAPIKTTDALWRRRCLLTSLHYHWLGHAGSGCSRRIAWRPEVQLEECTVKHEGICFRMDLSFSLHAMKKSRTLLS